MIINANTQLGLRFRTRQIKADLLKLTVPALKHEMELNKKRASELEDIAYRYKRLLDLGDSISPEEGQYALDEIRIFEETIPNVHQSKHPLTPEILIEAMDDGDSKYFFICDSVYRASEMIKVSENFTGRVFKDINFGKYTYLMGKHRMLRFIVRVGYLRGWYFDEEKGIGMSFDVDIEGGEYYYTGGFAEHNHGLKIKQQEQQLQIWA